MTNEWGHLRLRAKISIFIIVFAILLSLISFLIGYFSDLNMLDAFRIVFGSVYVLFLPGFVISFIFFPKTKKFDDGKDIKEEREDESGAIDWLERIALSFALSIAIVPLAVFYLNLIGLKINVLNSFLTILGIIIIGLGIIYWKNKRH